MTGADRRERPSHVMTRVSAATRTELSKLGAQLPLQLLGVAVIAGPIAFAGLLSSQANSPADALLGNWAHTSGFAVSLVLLSFTGNWGAPIIAGILAGDLFASEDRHRTWKTLLSSTTSLRELFLAKLCAAGILALLLGLALGAASLAGGVIFISAAPMVNLSGQLLSGLHLLGLISLAWLLTLLPLLAFTAIAVFVSILTRNAIVAVLAPVLVGLVNQLLILTGNGAWLHLLLLTSNYTAWTGLFVRHIFLGPAIVSELACLGWIGACLWGSWRVLSRREFVPGTTPSGIRRRVPGLPALRIVTIGVGVIALLALASTLGPAGVTDRRLTDSLASTFGALTTYQQNLLGHPIPAGSKYTILPLCNKRGARAVGPGDWDCGVNVYVLLPHGTQPLTDTPVDYDVSVSSNGCYKADAPAQIVGGATIRRRGGGSTLNPLTVVYGCFNVL